MEIAWAEADALSVEWDVRALTAPDGRDWTLAGATATLDGALDYAASFSGLDANGGVAVAVADGSGGITLAGAEVAHWNGSSFVDGACE